VFALEEPWASMVPQPAQQPHRRIHAQTESMSTGLGTTGRPRGAPSGAEVETTMGMSRSPGVASHRLDELCPGHHGHRQVHDDETRPARRDHLQGLGAVGREHRRAAGHLDDFAERLPDAFFVVDHEDEARPLAVCVRARHRAGGNHASKRVPPSAVDVTASVPPCAFTMHSHR
jgi:hypothetical protein